MKLRSVAILFLLGGITLCGCNRGPQLVYLPDQQQPVPITDLPKELRIKNWRGRNDNGLSGGSCVHASTINTFRTASRPDLEQRWFENRNRGYEGPETGYGIMRKFKDQRIPFAYTRDADDKLLEAASQTHRASLIFYYPSHCVNFVEFATLANGKRVAVLLDNNFKDRYIVIDRDIFQKSWEYYGGFALTPWIDPVTPRTFPRSIPKRYLTNG